MSTTDKSPSQAQPTPAPSAALTPKPADDVAGLPDVTELMWALDEAIDVFGKAAEQWGWESDQGSDADAKASEAEHKRTRGIVYDKADLVTAALRSAHATIATLRRQINERDAEVRRLRKALEVPDDLRALSEKATGGEWRVETDTTLVWGACRLDDDGFVEHMGVPVIEAQLARGWSRDGQPDCDRAQYNAALSARSINHLRAQIAATPAPAVDETGGGHG